MSYRSGWKISGMWICSICIIFLTREPDSSLKIDHKVIEYGSPFYLECNEFASFFYEKLTSRINFYYIVISGATSRTIDENSITRDILF